MSSHSRPRVWRGATLVAGIGAGLLFATSAINSHGVDLRGSSVTDLTTLLISEREHVNNLQDQIADVNAEITALSQSTHDSRVQKLQPSINALKKQAGFTPMSGPGVTVTLTDAPKSEIDRAQQTGDIPVAGLLVHQQDIQAVVNALWSGGASGISIQGQRVITTTGIKCVGNTVVLQGVPYAPPYVIRAVGNVAQLTTALNTSEYVTLYKTFTVPPYRLGWDLSTESRLDLPAYTGTSDLNYATTDPKAAKATSGSR